MSHARRKSLVEPGHAQGLSIARQCRLLSINRSSYYYQAIGETPLNLEMMRLIDEQFLETPWYGARQMARHLRRLGYGVSRKRTGRLMRVMGLSPIYQRPNTSKPHPEHVVYPYLLRGMTINAPNQVWCADVSYIPMRRGFLYLVAIMDWASRKVLSWRPWKMPWHGTGTLRYSTPTRGASSRALLLPARSKMPVSVSQWTARGTGWTT